MKIFFVGDFLTNTGPGIANRQMKDALMAYHSKSDSFIFSDANGRVGRILELFFKSIYASHICFCSPSIINELGIKMCKFLRKPCYYIMHGYLSFEREMNGAFASGEEKSLVQERERFIFGNVNKVICVSRFHKRFMMEHEPTYREKFCYKYNTFDACKNDFEKARQYRKQKKGKSIVSFGGGMRMKNNLAICKAIQTFEDAAEWKYTIAGKAYTDRELLCAYPFVEFRETVSHHEAVQLLRECQIYIQNSYFDTYNLSILEALLAGCDILLSKNIGALELLTTASDNDVIWDVDNISEISGKIKAVSEASNFARLLEGVEWDTISAEATSKALLYQINSKDENIDDRSDRYERGKGDE